jgi:hypothetical protein
MQRNQPIKVHVFVGAVTSVQRIPLLRAREAVLSSVAVDWLECSVARVKELEWRPLDLVQWLQEADIYLIISHIHQGILEKLQWDMVDLRESLRLLYDCVGYPRRNNLFCPVFLQDKFSYISSIRELCNPTIRISFDGAFCRNLTSEPKACLDMISR